MGSSSCALAEEAKTPSAATATIASIHKHQHERNRVWPSGSSCTSHHSAPPPDRCITRHSVLQSARSSTSPQGTIFAGTWTLLGVANFLERREGEVRRTPLPRTRMNRGNREGWVQGKPTSNSGKEKEPLGSKTHPTNTIARADELTVNSWRSSGQNAPTTH